MLRGVALVTLLLGVARTNIIHNGDFDSGDVTPWRCVGCQCESSHKYLVVTERSATWAGPRQSLESDIFVTEPFLYQLNFSLQLDTSDLVTAGVILHVVKGEEEKFMSLFNEQVQSSDWTDWSIGVNINNMVKGADFIELYFEAKPETVNFNLDNVRMEKWTSDDSWQEEANTRIEELRKSDVQINFVEVDATELSVEVEQVSHSFPFGQAVHSERIAECQHSGTDDGQCSFIRANYNWIVDTFRMKWGAIEPHRGDFKVHIPDLMIGWARDNNITVRGHSLLWHKSQPEWTLDLFGEDFTEAMFKHLDDTLDHFDSLGVKTWDVINEMVDQGEAGHTFYIDHSQDPDIRAKIYSHVKERYPGTMFFVNDYGIITDSHNRFSLYQQLIRDLLAAGAPIDAIGIQCHLNGNTFLDWNVMKERLDLLWEEFHLPIWPTEFDWNWHESADFGDHSYHAQVIDSFYRLMFSHQAVGGILSWTLNTLDSDNSPNRAGETYMRLYHQEWRTNISFTPQTSTSAAFRAFHGDYIVRIKKDQKTIKELQFKLEGDLNVDCIADIILGTLECAQSL